jgi:hypothetical protein
MSSWYRNVRALHIAPVLLLAATRLPAADVQTAWIADASTEWNTNRALEVGPTDSSMGYALEAGALFKIATPLSVTTLRPLLGYVTYPDQDENSATAKVDLASVFTGERSQFAVYGRFDFRDTLSSELAAPGFDDINPDLPTTPETGRLGNNGTRTLVTAVPNYQFAITQRADFRVSGTLQMADYDGSTSNLYVPYTYYSVETGFGWKPSPVSRLAVSAFAGRSENQNDDGTAESLGAALEYSRDITGKFTRKLRLTVEQDDVRVVVPTATRDKSTNLGADFTLSWRGEISQVDFNIGRTFTPGGSGGFSQAAQLQLDFRRRLSPLTELNWVARFIRYEALIEVPGSDYDYLNTGLSLRRQLARTWYIEGGAQYWREKFQSGANPDNVQVNLSFGYRGLQR